MGSYTSDAQLTPSIGTFNVQWMGERLHNSVS